MPKRIWRFLPGLFLMMVIACKEGYTPTPTITLPADSPKPVSKVAYHGLEGETGTIYLVDLRTKEEIRLTDVGESVAPHFSFSPDGRRLVYSVGWYKTRDIYVVNLDGTDKEKLTKGNADDSQPVWAPNGERIAFVSTREAGIEKVFIMGPDGSRVRRLTNEREIITVLPTWSPDGTKIACLSATLETAEAGNHDIRVVDVKTGQTQQLISNGFDNRTPAWSPDGSRLAYVSNKEGSYDVYVLDLASQIEQKLTSLEFDVLRVTWSPCGNRITFALQADGRFDIGVVTPNGSDPTLLTTTDANDVWATWSPDGNQIAFLSDRDGQGYLYVMQDDGSEQTRIGSAPAGAYSPPVWLPNSGATHAIVISTPQGTSTSTPTSLSQSQRIAFVSGQNNETEIYVLDLPTRQVTRLTDNDIPDTWPRWSPDGQQILFLSLANDNWDLWTMNVDGTSLRQQTDTGDIDEHSPVWSLSGRQIAFAGEKKDKRHPPAFSIVIMDADTRICRQVPTLYDGMVTNPFWMPDDKELAYRGDDVMQGGKFIKVFELEQDKAYVLLDGLTLEYPDVFPSPDRAELLYVAEEEGLHHVYALSVETGKTRLVASFENSVSDVSWSPDSRMIALVSASDREEDDIYVLGSEGQNMRKLVDTPGDNFDPAWSPSGDQIAFISMDGDRPDLWLVNTDGSGLTKLVENVNQFVWSP